MRIRHFNGQTCKYQCCEDFEITRYAQKSTIDVSTIESMRQSSESGAFLKLKDFQGEKEIVGPSRALKMQFSISRVSKDLKDLYAS